MYDTSNFNSSHFKTTNPAAESFIETHEHLKNALASYNNENSASLKVCQGAFAAYLKASCAMAECSENNLNSRIESLTKNNIIATSQNPQYSFEFKMHLFSAGLIAVEEIGTSPKLKAGKSCVPTLDQFRGAQAGIVEDNMAPTKRWSQSAQFALQLAIMFNNAQENNMYDMPMFASIKHKLT